MFARASLALLLTLTACGGDDSNSGTPADASTPSDTGSANSVQAVTCPANVALTVTTTSLYVFSPATTPHTIAVNDVVHFMMASSHNAVPTTDAPSDPGINVDYGGDKCLKFTKAGTFNFLCAAHNFRGSITVQ